VVGVAYLSQEDHVMLHGPAKRREIARSVLPSTRRQSARDDLASLRRRNRRTIRRDLNVIARPARAEAVVDDFDGTPADLRCYPDSDIRYAVERRRDGDKLGPLFRWARATTRHLPIDERLEAVRRLFDDNLIGRHALSHLEQDRDFRVVHEHERHWWFDRDRTGRSRSADAATSVRAIAAGALEYGDHAALNRWMKSSPTDKDAVRLLGGAHDVDAFASDCARCATWRHAVEAFAAQR
jgi:hypothetical protein